MASRRGRGARSVSSAGKKEIDYGVLLERVPVLIAANTTNCAHCERTPPALRVQGPHPIVFDTRFDRFLHDNWVSPNRLAVAAGVTRPALHIYRAELRECRRYTIARLVLALRDITGKDVRASDLFYLGESVDDSRPAHERQIEPLYLFRLTAEERSASGL